MPPTMRIVARPDCQIPAGAAAPPSAGNERAQRKPVEYPEDHAERGEHDEGRRGRDARLPAHFRGHRRFLAEEHRVQGLQERGQRQRAAEHGDDEKHEGGGAPGLDHPLIDEPLGHEAVQGRDSRDCQGGDQERQEGDGHLPGQAAEI